MEGRVRVLLHKQVPSVDLVDHDHLHGHAIGEHELRRRRGSRRCSNPPGPQGKSLNWQVFEKGLATQSNMAPKWQKVKENYFSCGKWDTLSCDADINH